MATSTYMKLKGQKQGQITGSVTQKGHEGSILVIAVDHSIVSPRDAGSGLPTGKRQHKPFVITKELDKSSPLLYNALVSGENITSWELQFWTAGQTGKEAQYYSVKLTNANISSIEFKMLNTKDPDTAKFAPFEEVAFTYQKIEWTWTQGGITTTDDWMARIA